MDEIERLKIELTEQREFYEKELIRVARRIEITAINREAELLNRLAASTRPLSKDIQSLSNDNSKPSALIRKIVTTLKLEGLDIT